MARRKSRIHLAGVRDTQLLTFLWKWKVSTSALLMRRFFPLTAPMTAYRRLWTLEKGGFIEAVANRSGRKFLWTLTKRGYAAIRHEIPCELKEDGFRSEHPGHDLLTAAFHLGDWMLGSPEGVRSFSEQQLRRYDTEFYPDYVPKTEWHRPDGYLHLGEGALASTFALEVEVSVKKKSRYGGVAAFYDSSLIAGVWWLVLSKGVARTIDEILRREDRGRGDYRHSFVVFGDFLRAGWGAEFVGGQAAGQSIRQVARQKATNWGTTVSHLDVSTLTLNVAKSPHKSKACKIYELGDFAI
jgi:hypothetical protein